VTRQRAGWAEFAESLSRFYLCRSSSGWL